VAVGNVAFCPKNRRFSLGVQVVGENTQQRHGWCHAAFLLVTGTPTWAGTAWVVPCGVLAGYGNTNVGGEKRLCLKMLMPQSQLSHSRRYYNLPSYNLWYFLFCPLWAPTPIHLRQSRQLADWLQTGMVLVQDI
jgi:hypothetical protein